MMNRPCFAAFRSLFAYPSLIAILLLGLSPAPTRGQSQTTTENLGTCTLKDHVYHCDGAAFRRL